MVAELRNGTEDYSAIAKATTATAVALDTKVFMVVTADLLSLLALKPSSKFGFDSVVDWMQWFRAHIGTGGPAAVYFVTSLKRVHRMPGRLIGESLDRLGNPTFRLGLQSQEQSQEKHIRLDEEQLTTDTADLKMTEDARAKDTAALEDITQDCLVGQTKVVDFEVYTKNLSEELEVRAKTKAVILEKTGDSEYRDNRSVLSSRGSLSSSLTKSQNSIELVQLTSHVTSTMHAEKGEEQRKVNHFTKPHVATTS